MLTCPTTDCISRELLRLHLHSLISLIQSGYHRKKNKRSYHSLPSTLPGCTTWCRIHLWRSSASTSPNPSSRVSFVDLPLLCQHLFSSSLAATLGSGPQTQWQISGAPTTITSPQTATQELEENTVQSSCEYKWRHGWLVCNLAMDAGVYHGGEDFSWKSCFAKRSGSGGRRGSERWMEGWRGTWRMRRWRDLFYLHHYSVVHHLSIPSISHSTFFNHFFPSLVPRQ